MPIQVRRHGASGPKVVVLHGGPGAPGSAVGLARGLADRFSVWEPLQRRAGSIPLTVSQHVTDLAEVMPAQAAVVGWSWGAMLGLSFAARFPDRVQAIALVGCGTYGAAERELYRDRMNQRLGPEGRNRMGSLAQQLESTPASPAMDQLLAEMGRLATTAQSYELLDEANDDLPPDARGYRETWQDVLRLQRDGVEPASFGAIRSPVLMLHGDDDPHPGTDICGTLKRVIPQIDYVGFARCGHIPWRERHARQAFLRALCDWLMRHRG